MANRPSTNTEEPKREHANGQALTTKGALSTYMPNLTAHDANCNNQMAEGHAYLNLLRWLLEVHVPDQMA